MIAGRNTQRATRRCARLTMVAGLAAGLGAVNAAHALPFVKISTNHEAWNSVAVPARDASGNILWDPATDDTDGDGFRDRDETPIVFRQITGQGVTIGMVEAAQPLISMTHPQENHIAFNGLNHRRIWYPFETRFVSTPSAVRGEILPRTTGGGPLGGSLKFPSDFHRHATAVAGAMVARNPSLFGDISTFGPVIGIAPNASLLTGALVTNQQPQTTVLGPEEGISPEAFLFTLAAMTDLDINSDGVGDFITPLATWYEVEPWDKASVINISFGQIGSSQARAGENVYGRICDIIVRKTNTVIVSSVGDEGMNGSIDEIDPVQGHVASPATAHNTIAVGRTGSGADIDDVQEDSGFGPILRFNWIHGDLDGNLYLQNPSTQEDYSDINFLPGTDPRDPMDQTFQLFPEEGGNNPTGLRTGVDIIAPGTLVALPADLTNPEAQLSTTDIWSDWQGTSFASAVVTGAVALMYEYGEAWEYSTDPLVIRAVLMNSAEKPDDWDNNAMPDPIFDFSFTSSQALDDRYGAGILDFERLLIQYQATAGGYADLDQSRQEVLLNSIRPQFRRDPAITSPNSGTPGTTSFMPVLGTLRSANRYFEEFVNGNGVNERREYFYTDPDFASLTFHSDPTNTVSNITQPNTDGINNNSTTRRVSDQETPVAAEGGWSNHSAQPIGGDRFGFPGVGGNRNGNTTGSGNRTGTTGTGNTTGGPRPGSGGEDGPSTQPQTSSGIKPCEDTNESRCIRAGWDIGRVGVGSIDLPIGRVPDNTDITATLVWNRIEEISDQVYENLLNGVITAEKPSITRLPEPGRLADGLTTDNTSTTDFADEINAGLQIGPPQKAIHARELKTWNGGAPNQKLYPLIMAGETLRGPAPEFTDLDLDKDGVIDMSDIDNCVITQMVPISPAGIPFDPNLDGYNPLQIDVDMDGCGPPCDLDDSDNTIPPADDMFCTLGGNSSTSSDEDSERLRRVSSDFVLDSYTTPKDELNIDPTALNGVVAIRINRGGGNFSFATGVLIDSTRVLTAAHVFDADSDGLIDSGARSPQILFPTYNRFLPAVVYTGGQVDSIALNPSFNFIGNRGIDMGPENVTVENGRDDLAIITVRGDTFPDFIDTFSGTGIIPYTGAELQIYDILAEMPPAVADGQEIIFAGYGESGDGRFGVAIDPNVPEEELPIGYVPVSLAPSGQPTPILRAGKNVIDFYPNLIDDDDAGNPDAPIEQYGFDFDERTAPDSLGNRIESMITFGDSGSPAFIHNDIDMEGDVDPGELQLFGINTMMAVNPADPRLSAFGSNGLGAVLNAYVGVDDDGNDRFIDAVLNELPPVPQGLIEFSNRRPFHFDLTTEFKFDNLDFLLFEETNEGIDLEVVATFTSASSNNVEHIFAQGVGAGNYFLRITWAGPVFDWSGFVTGGNTPFRKVQPLISSPPSPNDLTYDDITDFFPSEVKYGLAWWADLPFDRVFETSGAGSRSTASLMGDLNGDRKIDSQDVAQLISFWGTEGPEGDLTLDGIVGINDLVKLMGNYTK